LAICTANVPTPPDAPLIRTCCPGRTRAWSRSACRAVTAATGTDAACSKVTIAGFGTTLSRGTLGHLRAARATGGGSDKLPC